MILLLDTHALYWWDQEPSKLSVAAKSALSDPGNTVFISVVNISEIVLKTELRKMSLQDPIDVLVQKQCQLNGFRLLSIEPRHVYALRGLPYHHKDPFDRILLAQAIADGLILVSTDPLFAGYPVPLLW
jgi:PIN domain nuclease of toxin-antitoxin system